MRKLQRFLPSLGALEGRLVLSSLAPAVAPAGSAPAAVAPPASAPADVNQSGDFDGQFGDQTTVDGPPGAGTGGTATTPGGTPVNTEVDV